MKHRKDGRTTEPQRFTVFASKQTGRIGVRIADKRAYASVREVNVGQLGLPVRVTMTATGLQIEGEGVVRQLGDDTIAITA